MLQLTSSIFWQNIPKNNISGQKQKKWASPFNLTYWGYCETRVQLKTDNFDILDHIYPKMIFLI